MLKYSVYENQELVAIFKKKINALQYKDLLKDINRSAGYKDLYIVKEEDYEVRKGA